MLCEKMRAPLDISTLGGHRKRRRRQRQFDQAEGRRARPQLEHSQTCGGWSCTMQELDDQAIWELISTIEDELLADGLDPKQRHFQLPVKAMERLGYTSFALSGPHEPALLRRIRAIHQTLYRTKDVAVGGLHGGAFMFRGIAIEVRVPMFFGSVRIHPFEHNDLSPRQKEWLASDPKQVEAYVSTFCDIFDFAACLYSFNGYGKPPDGAMHLLSLAAFQLQGAGATLCAAFDERGAIQSSLVGAELALKAALAGNGASEADLKGYGHDLERLATTVRNVYESFELTSVKARMRVLPKLVENRYSSDQPSRMETGDIVMASQYIAGAVARALTRGSFRARLLSK